MKTLHIFNNYANIFAVALGLVMTIVNVAQGDWRWATAHGFLLAVNIIIRVVLLEKTSDQR